ncbi:hypothetical protein BC834DRAFT_608814 [Gloeopeniophorella convolvens]|nr:hypothetical protein BC834DRAFT_608814 [Gloeopeniophorella convolvens]
MLRSLRERCTIGSLCSARYSSAGLRREVERARRRRVHSALPEDVPSWGRGGRCISQWRDDGREARLGRWRRVATGRWRRVHLDVRVKHVEKSTGAHAVHGGSKGGQKLAGRAEEEEARYARRQRSQRSPQIVTHRPLRACECMIAWNTTHGCMVGSFFWELRRAHAPPPGGVPSDRSGGSGCRPGASISTRNSSHKNNQNAGATPQWVGRGVCVWARGSVTSKERAHAQRRRARVGAGRAWASNADE